EPACCVEPSCCCAPSCCNSCCRKSFCLFDLFKCKKTCCNSCCNSCGCGTSCGCDSYHGNGHAPAPAAGGVHDAAPVPPAPMADPSASVRHNRRVVPASRVIRK